MKKPIKTNPRIRELIKEAYEKGKNDYPEYKFEEWLEEVIDPE